mmetsp:Transcript_6550/g.13142  ORF Transcript_6550/g.13142 Transcript_6550/m.13142 type:complete len:205 (+) Transcript_6550:393-1007(+)
MRSTRTRTSGASLLKTSSATSWRAGARRWASSGWFLPDTPLEGSAPLPTLSVTRSACPGSCSSHPLECRARQPTSRRKPRTRRRSSASPSLYGSAATPLSTRSRRALAGGLADGSSTVTSVEGSPCLPRGPTPTCMRTTCTATTSRETGHGALRCTPRCSCQGRTRAHRCAIVLADWTGHGAPRASLVSTATPGTGWTRRPRRR